MIGTTYTARLAFHRDRLRRTKRTKRAILAEAARLAALLDARDASYRRLLVTSTQREADRRFAEAVGTILVDTRAKLETLDADGRRTVRAGAYLAISDRFGELDLDHRLAEVDQ